MISFNENHPPSHSASVACYWTAPRQPVSAVPTQGQGPWAVARATARWGAGWEGGFAGEMPWKWWIFGCNADFWWIFEGMNCDWLVDLWWMMIIHDYLWLFGGLVMDFWWIISDMVFFFFLSGFMMLNVAMKTEGCNGQYDVRNDG